MQLPYFIYTRLTSNIPRWKSWAETSRWKNSNLLRKNQWNSTTQLCKILLQPLELQILWANAWRITNPASSRPIIEICVCVGNLFQVCFSIYALHVLVEKLLLTSALAMLWESWSDIYMKKWKLICLNAGRVETNRACFFPKLAWGAIIVCAFVYKTVCGMHGAYCNGKIVQFQVSVVEQVFQISDQYMDDELLWPGKWKLVATALWPLDMVSSP